MQCKDWRKGEMMELLPVIGAFLWWILNEQGLEWMEIFAREAESPDLLDVGVLSNVDVEENIDDIGIRAAVNTHFLRISGLLEGVMNVNMFSVMNYMPFGLMTIEETARIDLLLFAIMQGDLEIVDADWHLNHLKQWMGAKDGQLFLDFITQMVAWFNEGGSGIAVDFQKQILDGLIKTLRYLYGEIDAVNSEERDVLLERINQALEQLQGVNFSQGALMRTPESVVLECRVISEIKKPLNSIDFELLMAAALGDVDKVRELLRRGADVNARAWGKNKVLYDAAAGRVLAGRGGNAQAIEQLRKLLEAEVHEFRRGQGDEIALYMAITICHVRDGALKVARELIEAGATLNEANQESCSALGIALYSALCFKPKVVQLAKILLKNNIAGREDLQSQMILKMVTSALNLAEGLLRGLLSSGVGVNSGSDVIYYIGIEAWKRYMIGLYLSVMDQEVFEVANRESVNAFIGWIQSKDSKIVTFEGFLKRMIEYFNFREEISGIDRQSLVLSPVFSRLIQRLKDIYMCTPRMSFYFLLND